ncbi:MAG: glutathione S-transferase family protein [Gammaproteobacteria bacterium]|nr:glutathione S-transferase family protein [Gammaproteobacteria bacterium]
MSQHTLRLVSYDLCPYVQRSIITLTEKNVKYEIEYIDLGSPPEWFIKRSPLKKVPLLIVDDKHDIFESAVICELVDEITPGSLHSGNPVIKAQHRSWIEFGSRILDKIGALYNSKSEKSYVECLKELASSFSRLNDIVVGPYFAGDTFHMVDAVYATVFRYFDVMDSYFTFDIFEDCDKVNAWRLKVAQRPAVQTAVLSTYQTRLENFFINKNSYLSTQIHP